MSLLQTTISEPQMWLTSHAQRSEKKLCQHSDRRTELSISRSTGSGEAIELSQAIKEQELIQRALGRDPDALSPLFDQYISRLTRVALSVLHNKEDAEDAVQDGLLNAYLHLDSFQGRSQFSTWLTRIVVNAALMVLRRKRARPETSLEENQERSLKAWPTWTADPHPNPEQACATVEIKEGIRKQIDQLTPGVRSAFWLRQIAGLSTKQVGEALGIQENAAKSRLSRARTQLRRSLPGLLRTSRAEKIPEISDPTAVQERRQPGTGL